MVWNDWIVKYFKIVLVVWIVIIVFMVLFVGKLSEFIDYSMEQMVFYEIELIKVQDLMVQEFMGVQNDNFMYFFIMNINVNDENVRKVYYFFKDWVEGKYVFNVIFYYDVLDMFWEMDYEFMFNVIRMIVNIMGFFYMSVKGVYDGYGMVFNQVFFFKNIIDMVKISFVGIVWGYVVFKNNFMFFYIQFNVIVGLFQMVDGIYVQFCVQNLNMIVQERVQVFQNELMVKVFESQQVIVFVVVQVVVFVDFYCMGMFFFDEGLFENMMVEFVYGMIMNVGVFFLFEILKEVFFQFYESGGSEIVIDIMVGNMFRV